MVLDLLIQFIYHIVMEIFVSNKFANIKQVWMWGKKIDNDVQSIIEKSKEVRDILKRFESSRIFS